MSTSASGKDSPRRRGSPLAVVIELFRAEMAADPHGFVFKTQVYHRRLTGGVLREAQCPWEEALYEQIAALSGPKSDREAARRCGETLRAFLRGLDWSRDEAAIERAVEEGQPVEVILRLEAAELFALPWELVTLGESGAPLGELPNVTIRYQWPGTKTAKRAEDPPREGGRMLFAWSAAGGAVPADEHLNAIKTASRAGISSFDSTRDVLSAVTYKKLSEALEAAEKEGAPFTALHLLCHGGRTDGDSPTFGLVWGDDSGDPRVVHDGATLAGLLRPHAGYLRLVILAACQGADSGAMGNHLGSVAQELHRAGIEAVIASRFPLGTDASTLLTQELYRGLLRDLQSVEEAFSAARRRVQSGAPRMDHLSLQLHARETDTGMRPFVVRPYRGLLVFDREHRGFFFGRDAEIREIIGDLGALVRSAKPRFLVVAGASGTGKSSLVRAGAVPAMLDMEPTLAVTLARPSKDLDEVIRGLEEEVDSRPRLVVVDQFEEIFTHIEDPAARESLVSRLWRLASSPGGGVRVLVTLRVDFIGRCGEIRLGDAGLRLDAVAYDEAHRVFVAQMMREQLEETILRPARRAGLSFDDGLARTMLEEVGEEPGALPLVQYALDQIWLRRENNRLTQGAYAAIGGVSGALQKQADALVSALSEREQKAARRLLVRLVGTQGDASAVTRRRVSVAELRPVDDERALSFDIVLAKLSDARLLVRDWQGEGASIEVAHESLIRRWDHLRRWVEEDRKTLAELEQVEGWKANWKKFPEALLSGDALGYARQVRGNHSEELGPDTLEFVRLSEEAERKRHEEEEARRKEKQKQLQKERRRFLFSALFFAMSTVVLAAVGLYIWETKKAGEASERRAREAALIAGAKEQLASGQTQWALQLLLQAESPDTIPGWMDLAHEILERPIPRRTLRGHQGEITAAQWSPDGKRVVTASQDGTARVWDAEGKGDPIVLKGHSSPIVAVAWSPDSRRIVTGSSDKTARIWDADGKGEPRVLAGHDDAINAIAWSPDGRRIASVSDDKTGRVWDADGKGDPLLLKGHQGNIAAVAWSPDGQRVVTASRDGTACLWDGAARARVSSIDRVRERLDEVNADCLPPALRIMYLAEPRAVAEAAYEQCERSRGRTP